MHSMQLVLLLLVVVCGHVLSKSLEHVEGLDDDIYIDSDFNAAEIHQAFGGRVKRQIDFEHAKDWIKQNIPVLIKKIRIPDLKKNKFWYSYALTGAKVTKYTLPQIAFSTSGDDVIARANGGEITAGGNYKVRLAFLKSSGTVEVTVRNVNLTLRGSYDGKIHIKSCSGSVGSVGVTVSNKFINSLRKHIEKPLKLELEKKLCEWTKKFQ